MLDTIQKLKYRADAQLPGAAEALNRRLSDRMELPLPGIHNEKIFLTDIGALRAKVKELNALYEKLPAHRIFKEKLLLDAWSSATIEGARTTVDQVKKAFDNPKSKDDKMVVNAINASRYAYKRQITAKNIRRLWEMIVRDVCENTGCMGVQYRSGMVYVASSTRTVHTPASAEMLPELMEKWFTYRETQTEDTLIQSFAAHFYFVYLHPFCDGNGRTARILNASHLYHSGYSKMKNLPLSNAINANLPGYYAGLSDSEAVLNASHAPWLDLSPFVSYMLDVFEQSMLDAALSVNALTGQEKKLLERMNKIGGKAEITSANAGKILNIGVDSARQVLRKLAQKGYLSADTTHSPHIYRLEKHLPEALL